MNKGSSLLTFALLAVLFGISPARAVANSALGDTFQFDITGYNLTTDDGFYIVPQETSTVGQTQTYTSADPNGDTVTISSSETDTSTEVTDTFTVSVPTNFLPADDTVGGEAINELEFDLGNSNAGGNTVDFTMAIPSYTASGTAIYGTTDSSLTLTPSTTLSNGNKSVAAAEGVSDSGNLASDAVHSFTYSIVTPIGTTPAPEPSTLALGGFGMILCGLVAFFRRLRLVA